MFRVFGHDKVWVLDGGLPQWRASGYDVESSASSDAILKASAAGEAIEKVYQGQSVIFPPISFGSNSIVSCNHTARVLLLLLSYGVLIHYRYD